MLTKNHPLQRKDAIFSWVAVIVLGVVLWWVYGRAMGSPLVFDDAPSVEQNPSLVRLWPLLGADGQPGPLNPPKDLPTSGRPLVNLSLALNYHFGGLNPAGYHAFNLAVHLLAAMLLGLIVQRLLRLECFGGRFAGASGPLAFLAALLWAVHPLNTETVVYITQRTELMVGLFYLATLYGSLRYWGAASAAGRRTWLILTTLACLAGMACKEVMVTAPLLVLLFQRTFATGSFRQALRKSWPLYAGLAGSWLLLLALNIDRPRGASAGFHLEVTPLAWWCTQAQVLWRYLKLVVWPWPLSIHYPLVYLTFASAWPWLLATALLAIGVLILLWRRQPAGYVGAWVLLILSPTFFVPIVTEVMAERRMYLPLAALITLAVAGGYWAVQWTWTKVAVPRAVPRTKERWRVVDGRILAVVGSAALTLALACCLLDIHRLAAYHDALALWEDTAATQPNDSVAHELLGDALFSAGQPSEAIQQLQKAIELQPASAVLHQKLGVALVKSDHLAEAIKPFEEALRLDPNNTENYKNLATAYGQMHRSADAISTAEKAIALAQSQGNAALAQKIETWLRDYRASSP